MAKRANLRLMAVAIMVVLIGGSVYADLTDGLVAHWKLDGNANDSVGSNHGAIYGATPTTGQIDGALDFDGVNDYIYYGDILDNEIRDEFTIGVWIKLGEGALQKSLNYILWKSDDRLGIRVNSNDEVVFVHWYSGAGSGFTSTHILEEGKWYYISYVFDGSEFIGYINAEYTGATPDSGYSSGGSLFIASDNGSRCFKGTIDDVRIYNRAFSANEIRQLYGIELTHLEIIGPPEVAENSNTTYKAIAHYDNESTKDVTDSADWSVEPNDIASIAAGLLTTEMIDLPEDVTITAQYSEGGVNESAEKDVSILTICPSGSALEFDGQNDYVDCGNLGIHEPVTVSIWLKPDNTTSDRRILGHIPATLPYHGGALAIDPYGSDAHDVFVWDGYSWKKIVDLSSSWLGQWHHLAIVIKNDKSITAYFDGIEQLTTTSSFDFYDVSIGLGSKHPQYGNTFDGIMDEAVIYNRALSAEEIQAIMHSRPNVDDPSLVGYWDFDEGEGQVAGDSSVHGNDGQLGSTANEDGSDPEWIISDAPVGICVPVDVDIKPGSCPNPLNLNSKGVLPVAILGTEDFDVTAIDSASVFLEGVGPIRSSYEDVSTPVSNSNECECSEQGPDGYIDLTLKFRTQEIVKELINLQGQLEKGQELVLTFDGELFDGGAVRGTDCVKLVGNVSKWLEAQRWDANGDGIVNFLDLTELANYWLESE